MNQTTTGPSGQPGSKVTQDDIEQLVRARLSENPAHETWFGNVSFHYMDGVLQLRGRVSSFYQKQILQSLLRDIEGVDLIDNQTEVDWLSKGVQRQDQEK